MQRPKLLYASPFWPQRSGISEYSETLLAGLADFFDVTLLADDVKLDAPLSEIYPVVKCKEKIDFAQFDYIIYNFGNNPEYHGYMYDLLKQHPGYVILHDFSLYYLTVDHYDKENLLFQKIYEMHGVNGIKTIRDGVRDMPHKGLLENKNLSSLLPLNKEILRLAKGIFVHSQYAADKVLEVCPEAHVYKINLAQNPIENDSKTGYLCERYKLDERDVIIGALGFIAPSKQNEVTCWAVDGYNQLHKKPITYCMVGEGNYADHLLSKQIHKTGFLQNEEYFSALSDCDIIINLRYPYGGETSATLLQAMACGKPCIATDIGWFSELPDDCVVKVPWNVTSDELGEAIERILSEDAAEIGIRAQNHISENYAPLIVAREIREAVNGWEKRSNECAN